MLTPPPSGSLSPPHPSLLEQGVMVVDDSELQRNLLMSILRMLGITHIHEACDGESALALLGQPAVSPAIIVVDLEMPGMDGIELLQLLAERGLRASILVVSGAESAILAAVGTMAEALGLQLLGTLPKPLSYLAVSNMMTRFYAQHRQSRHATPGQRPGASPPPDGAAVTADSLIAALDDGRVVPYYQPVVSLKTGKVLGFEALARLVTTTGKLILPGNFIELAEQQGLIDRLTLAIVDHVLADLGTWHSRGLYPSVSFNVSARSLSDREFANEILRRVDAADISPRSLVIEVTESAVVSDLASAIGTLGRLRLRGFGLAIDDYGSGFSSMQQLSRLPFTTLKIDRTFVSNAHQKWNLQTMLQSAIEMGHRLGLVTVAEGVETMEEMMLLESLGCQCVQGFLLSPAMAAAAVPVWLRQEKARIRALCGEAM
ncbi:EAL domain-containing response regulator [Uliginosibacterium sp. H3]|uniref:EAL domain-containing response regulator n=1 Tax=Uliginosibacterium silvisoli TaxID=3114758 RepID=A0ABU6K812_9RHOO|nr:EAL domain-containing response regulator [Uliginosibacterium sp. H3]